MKKIVAALAMGAALTGCAGSYTSATFKKVNPPDFDAVRNWPSAGERATVQVGETMISAHLAPVMPALVVDEPFRLVTLYRRDLRMAIDIPAGTLELAGTDDAGGRYFGVAAGVRLSYESKGAFGSDSEKLLGGFHIASTGAKSVYWIWPDATSASLAPAPSKTVDAATVEHPARRARFQKQLVYSGTSQTTVSILYREISNDMARPAFNQDLKYELAKGQVIGYQSARFEVIEAGNTSITYRVLAPLEIDHPKPLPAGK